jgi:hypothetical protein
MPTKQLPFFLNSAKGSNLTPLGNAFDVKLDPPVKIPVDARDTRIFVQSASAVYSFSQVLLRWHICPEKRRSGDTRGEGLVHSAPEARGSAPEARGWCTRRARCRHRAAMVGRHRHGP